jgi:hypothetical protein
MLLFLKVAKKIEYTAFVKKKELSKITLGDWIVEDIYDREKLIFEVSDFKLGVDEKQLDKIKELSKNNSNLNKLLVKDGLAFLPPLFIGFLIVIFLL